MSALFDFSSLLVVILLFICATTFARSLYPTIFNDKTINRDQNNIVDGNNNSSLDMKHGGLYGFCWKASRIGERLSPYVAAGCIVMAIHILFLK